MSTLSATIRGNAVSILESAVSLQDPLETRSVLTFTVVDASGTAQYYRGDPVVLTDSVAGDLYRGFVQNSAPTKLSPDPASTTILHAITCMDKQYLFDKRTNNNPYTSWYAGDVAVDLVQRIGSFEGVSTRAAIRSDRTTADFNVGILSNTVGLGKVADGDLEIVPSGTGVSIIESTQADFSTGALTNVTALAHSLIPTQPYNIGIPALRTSPAYDVSGAGLLGSSEIHWSVSTPSNTTFALNSSVDGGITWQVCTSGQPIPDLVPGQSMSSKTLILQEIFTSTNAAFYATLVNVTATIVSAAQATKTDSQYFPHLAADWNAGTFTNTAAIGDALSLNIVSAFTSKTSFDGGGFTDTGSATRQVSESIVASGAAKHAHVRLNGVGPYTTMTYVANLFVVPASADVAVLGMTYLNPAFNSTAGTFGYCFQMFVNGGIQTLGQLVRGSAGGSTTIIAGPVALIGSQLSGGTMGAANITITYSGGVHHVYATDGSLLLTATDNTFTTASLVGVYVTDNGGQSSGLTAFADFTLDYLINAVGTASWVSPTTSLTSIGNYGNSIIRWVTTNPTLLLVESSLNGGATYATCTEGSTLPGLTNGTSLSGVNLVFRLTLTLTPGIIPILTPLVTSLRALVVGQYTASGTRSTIPLGNDTTVRTDQAGWGTAFDGQTWVKTGTGADAIASNEATITNTTGDVHEVLGARAGIGEEGTVRVALSASTISGGIELRYSDANNYYRLAISTTTLTLIRRNSGVSTTLATTSVTLATNTFYRVRFRAVGYLATLSARVWLDGTLEPTAWNITATG